MLFQYQDSGLGVSSAPTLACGSYIPPWKETVAFHNQVLISAHGIMEHFQTLPWRITIMCV